MAIKTININENTWNTAKKLYPSQLSSKIQDYLDNLINFSKANSDSINKQLLIKERDELTKELNSISAKLENINDKINTISKIEFEKEKEDLLKEKEQADKLITCAICNIPKPEEKLHTLPGGIVCHACYMSEPGENLKKYLQPKEGP